MRLSNRLRGITPSATLAITAQTKALLARGVDVVGFGAGEPDFDTPTHIRAAAASALEAGFTKYTPTAGTVEFREAICRKLEVENGLEYGPEQILVSCGAKHSLFNFFQAVLNPGDEVLIPSPFWVSYPEIVRLASGEPVFVPAAENDGFHLRAENVRSRLTPRSRILVINSPANPTGSGLERPELEALAKLAAEHDLFLVSDEIYEKLVYDGFRHVSIASLDPEVKGRTVVINGFSKSFAMTGWRLGYAAAERELISTMTTIQDHSTSNPTSFAQHGGIEALLGPQDTLARMVREFSERKKLLVRMLRAVPGVTCVDPRGALYVFPNFSEHYGRSFRGNRIAGSVDLSTYLLQEGHVAAVPGIAFGSDAHLRLCFAIEREKIISGVDRIAAALDKLD